MIFDANRDVKIARRRAVRSRIALPGHAQSGALLRSRRNAHLHRLGVRNASVAMAGRALVGQAAGALAARASEAEAHSARHLSHGAAAVAFGAYTFAAGACAARAIARGAYFLAIDLETHLGPADGLPEIDTEAVFEVGALLGSRLLRLMLASEPLAEDVLEIRRVAGAGAAGPRGTAARAARPGRACEVREVESAEAHVRTGSGTAWASRTARRHSVFRIEAVLIVHLFLLRLAQNVVGFLDFLEAVLGGLVAGIQVRMMFAREFAVGLADLIRTRGALHSEGLIVVVLRHTQW